MRSTKRRSPTQHKGVILPELVTDPLSADNRNELTSSRAEDASRVESDETSRCEHVEHRKHDK